MIVPHHGESFFTLYSLHSLLVNNIQMDSGNVLLPGETLPPSTLPIPTNPSIPLKLGPGLRHIPPSTVIVTTAGNLNTDARKNAMWVENNNGRVSVSKQFLHTAMKQICKAKSSHLVHSFHLRPRPSDSAPLLNRQLSLLDNTTHSLCHPLTSCLRKCHQEVATTARIRCSALRKGCSSVETPGP